VVWEESVTLEVHSEETININQVIVQRSASRY